MFLKFIRAEKLVNFNTFLFFGEFEGGISNVNIETKSQKSYYLVKLISKLLDFWQMF
jgi:hypothetical protein